MTHTEIVNDLNAIFAKIGDTDLPWVGFGRVLEAMEDIAEHSPDEMVREAFPSIKQALRDVEEAKGASFQVVDAFDTRTDAEVSAAMGVAEFTPLAVGPQILKDGSEDKGGVKLLGPFFWRGKRL